MPPSRLPDAAAIANAQNGILVNNAAHQATFKSIQDISDEEWELNQFEHLEMLMQSIKARLRTHQSQINQKIRNPR